MTTSGPARPIRKRRLKPHQLAWTVLLLSFGIFCAIAVAALVSINNFLFLSTLPLDVALSVGRGTVGITELPGTIERVGVNGPLPAAPLVIRADPQSQGMLRFTDGQTNGRLLATMTLQRSAAVTLLAAQRPRFDWSRSDYELHLENVIGEIELDISTQAGQEMRVYGHTPGGARLQLGGPGRYTLEGASEELRLFNQGGRVRLQAPDGVQVRSVPAGRQGAVRYEEGRIALRPGLQKLLQDSDFQRLRQGGSVTEELPWFCASGFRDQLPGVYEFLPGEGGAPLRFLRGAGATTHGITFCNQDFGRGGLELNSLSLDSLTMRASFYIEHHSLASCGIEGSECPLMLRMDFYDAAGMIQQWYHGFTSRPQEAWPLRCSSCLQDHELVNRQVWYSYESPNLLTLFQPQPPPERIVSITFYASGHEYDVRIADVSLLAIAREGNAPTGV